MRTRKASGVEPSGAPVDAVLSRDRGRLLRLRSAAARAPGDPAAQAAFAARAAAMPVPAFDESLPVAREADAIAALIRAHPVVVVAGNEAVCRTARSVLSIADDADDEPTEDLLIGRLQIHEKYAWMLRSLLE